MMEKEIKLDDKIITREELEEKKKNLRKDQIIRESSGDNTSYKRSYKFLVRIFVIYNNCR